MGRELTARHIKIRTRDRVRRQMALQDVDDRRSGEKPDRTEFPVLKYLVAYPVTS